MNANTAYVNEYSNVIPFSVIKNDNTNNKFRKDGFKKNTINYKQSGVSSEVYAFKTKEEIEKMINVFNKHIEESHTECQRKIAYRNKLLFIVGINVGLRASDLRNLKWSFFIDFNTGEVKEYYLFQPIKQRKSNKFVKVYFNNTVKKAINNYISEYPVEKDGYVFFSRKRDDSISIQMLWKIIKDTAYEAGIKQNIGSHSLRKSFGYWTWHNADDKNKALVILQQIFNHSSTQVTAKYIGILDTEIKDMFDSIELGFESL